MLDVMTRRNAPQIAQDRRDTLKRPIAFLSNAVCILMLCALIGLGFILPRTISQAVHSAAIQSPL